MRPPGFPRSRTSRLATGSRCPEPDQAPAVATAGSRLALGVAARFETTRTGAPWRDLPPRFGGAEAHRAAARDQRLLRDRLARVASRLGVGDVLRVLREPPLHGGEAAPRDAEGEVEAHDGASLPRSGLTEPYQRRIFSVSWSISSLVVTTRVFAV